MMGPPFPQFIVAINPSESECAGERQHEVDSGTGSKRGRGILACVPISTTQGTSMIEDQHSDETETKEDKEKRYLELYRWMVARELGDADPDNLVAEYYALRDELFKL